MQYVNALSLPFNHWSGEYPFSKTKIMHCLQSVMMTGNRETWAKFSGYFYCHWSLFLTLRDGVLPAVNCGLIVLIKFPNRRKLTINKRWYVRSVLWLTVPKMKMPKVILYILSFEINFVTGAICRHFSRRLQSCQMAAQQRQVLLLLLLLHLAQGSSTSLKVSQRWLFNVNTDVLFAVVCDSVNITT